MSSVHDKKQPLDPMRHSTAHLLAAAVMELYPKTKRAIGPAIESGFYYDFEFAEPFSETQLPKIEKRMRQLVTGWHEFKCENLSIKDALKLEKGNPYKTELIKELGKTEKTVSFYKSGRFTDLCRGGHVKSGKEIGPFKLTHLAGAYWRGSEKNKMLTRIYGTAWPTQEELDNHLTMLEEAKRRDHKKLGKELDIFAVSETVGPGLPLLTERGTLMVNLMMNLVKKLQEPLGYNEVRTPHFTKIALYETSGHAEKFPDLFKVVTKEKETLAIKPVNCPHHIQLYARKGRSYRELPIKMAEFSTLYRDELSGTLGGLTRVRGLTQDDAHVFCREDQIEKEFDQIFGLVKKVMRIYGLDYRLVFSTHDPKNMKAFLGDKKIWDKAETVLEKIINKHKIPTTTAVGEAAIYGPKLDLMATDSLGREWQLSTIQLDFNMPKRFGIEYTDEKGQPQTPVMIHRALHGTFERFLGILIEHHAGAFPLWLAPEQVRVLPISDKHLKYAVTVSAKLTATGVRSYLDDSNNTVGKKIRETEIMKVPYVLVVGDLEAKRKTVSVRAHGSQKTKVMKIDSFLNSIKKELVV